MADKFYLAAQAAGFISFQEPIADASTYAPGPDHQLSIPEGLINIGGNGRGYYVDSETFVISPALTSGNYVLYASSPTGSETAGKAVIKQPVTVQTYTSDPTEQTAIWEGDDSGRRAIATFRVRVDNDDGGKAKIDPTSVRTVTNFDYQNLLKFMEEYGLYVNYDGNYTYRGQNIIQDASIGASVQNMDVVYFGGSNYDPALADDTEKELVIGVVEEKRDSVYGKNIVMTSGVIDTTGSGGQNDLSLDSELYAYGTYLYLSETVAGKIVRQFDKWYANHNYNVGDFILEGDKIWKVVQISGSGTSHSSTEPTWATPSTYYVDGDSFVNGTNGLIDNAGANEVRWGYYADNENAFQGESLVRIGTSLGSGMFVLNAAVGSPDIDDHNDSAFAHPTLTTAINKAGIYQLDASQGASTFTYRGQHFDENATFDLGAPVVDYDIVYMKSDGKYYQALIDADDISTADAIGIALDVSAGAGYVIGSGFVTYDTTTLEGSAASVGDKVYLSYTTAGKLTTTKRKTNNIEVGTVMATGVVNTGYILINIKGDRYIDQAIDEDASFSTNVVQYDVVYGKNDGGDGIEYDRAIVDGTTKENFLGICIDAPSTGDKGIVQSQGYINMGTSTTGTGSTGTLGYLTTIGTPIDVGDKVYLSIDPSYPGKLTSLASGVEIGKYVGKVGTEYYLLMSGTGGSGSGDATLEDSAYSTLLNTSTFSQMYYDTFVDPGTVDAATATFANSKYSGTIGQYVQQQVITAPTGGWSTGAKTLGDTILADNYVWECIDASTSSGTEPDWTNIVDNTNLEAHYTMDSVSGAVLADETANAYDGTITNAVQDTGRISQALNFLATDAYVNCGTSMGTALGGAVTDLSVSLWFKAVVTNSDDGLFYIGSFAGADGAFQLSIASDNLTYEMSGGFSQTYAFTDTSEKFHHLVATFDGTNGRLYLDSVAVIDTTTGVPANLSLTGLNTVIGAFYNTTGYSFNGSIDQVRVYNQALTAVDVRNLYRENANTIGIGTVIEDAGNTVWEAIRNGTDYRFSVHKEESEDALIYAQYSLDSSPSTWYPVPAFDEVIFESGGFDDLHLKFFFGATGNLESFGVLYEYENQATASSAQLNEVYTQSGAGSINDLITVPNNGSYTVDGNSLFVFTGAGLKLNIDDHYEEVDKYTIKMLYALSDTDKLRFYQYYGAVDNSVENDARLNIRHNSTGHLERSPRVSTTTTDTLTTTDDFIIINPASANQTFNLLAIAAIPYRQFDIINISTTYDTVITPNGAETIDGSASYTLYAGTKTSITIVPYGTDWMII